MKIKRFTITMTIMMIMANLIVFVDGLFYF